MGEVDLHFKPSVPVFDANVALGRRHDRRVNVGSVEETLEAMDRTGVDRAVVYTPHAMGYDSVEGNSYLMELVDGQSRFVPQFVCNPSYDDLDTVAASVRDNGITSVRMMPAVHHYPFRDWVVKPWMDWLAAEGIPLWIPVKYDFIHVEHVVDGHELHETLAAHPDVRAVLCEAQYHEMSWVMPLLRSLPNIYIELSRSVNTDVLVRMLDAVGEERIVFGSRFPDGSISPMLYGLHRYGLSDASLAAICAGNLERLLGMG